MFSVSIFKISLYCFDYMKNYKISKQIADSIIIEETNEDNIVSEVNYKIDFNKLKEQNTDAVGFLKVNGIGIQQVIVQGKDNSFYLNHSFNKDKNLAGWIFADYKNKLDGNDQNIVIYGHNMKNGTMFSNLKKILNDDWCKDDENRIIILVTENEEYMYKVFSVYQIEDEDYYIKTQFNNNEDFKKFIDTMKLRSKFNFNEEVDENDKILTLSTCADNNKYRIVLHAKR